jgi:hypothetical protein
MILPALKKSLFFPNWYLSSSFIILATMLVQVVLEPIQDKLQMQNWVFKVYKSKNKCIESVPEIVSGHVFRMTENSISNVEIVVSPPETKRKKIEKD